MAKFKVVIGTKSGKTLQKELTEEESKVFLGKVLKEVVKGKLVGFPSYEFLITGGSDDCGFPMRWDVSGTGRQRILAVAPTVGLKKTSKSKKAKIRKLVCGNVIHEKIAQINLKVIKEGAKPLFEEKAEKKQEIKEEKPVEEKKEEPKQEPKQEVKQEEPKVEKKEEATETKVRGIVEKIKEKEAGKKEPSAEEILKKP